MTAIRYIAAMIDKDRVKKADALRRAENVNRYREVRVSELSRVLGKQSSDSEGQRV